VGHVAEVTVDSQSRVKVDRVFVGVDCYNVVNPKIIEARMESGAIYGLTAALYGEISVKNGQVQELNFDTYRMLRMSEMPAVEAHIVPSREPPGGLGEPGLPPIAPAVANALFAATGKRVRRLPIREV
jgi:CO/xanthine dehydrogenase Mo-binding subunit